MINDFKRDIEAKEPVENPHRHTENKDSAEDVIKEVIFASLLKKKSQIHHTE